MNFLNLFSRLIFFVALFSFTNAYYYVIMRAETTASIKDFCVYSEKPSAFTKEVDKANPRTLDIGNAVNWCANDSQTDSSDTVLLLPSGKCSLSTQIQNFYATGGKVVIFINNRSLDYMNFLEREYLEETAIPIMKVSQSSAKELKEMGETITVRLFKPRHVRYMNLWVILVTVAVLIVSVSSYMSGHTTYKYFTEKLARNRVDASEEPPAQKMRTDEAPPLKGWLKVQHLIRETAKKLEVSEEYCILLFAVTPPHTVFMILALLITIVMGYSLKGYVAMLYTFSSLFITFIFVALCLHSWTRNFRSYGSKYTLTFYNTTVTFPVFSFALNFNAFCLTTLWIISKDTKYGWLVQNFICLFVCFGFLRLFRLPSLKVYTAVLVLFVILDTIITYFICHFDKNENTAEYLENLNEHTAGYVENLAYLNYMEDVGTGRKHNTFMNVLEVNDFGSFALGACFPIRVLLGFECVMVPGLLLAYCCAFDLCSNSDMIYYMTSVIFYAIGMSLSEVVADIWHLEQSTFELSIFLFNVPIILIPIVLLASCRGELYALWNGLKVLEKERRTEEQNAEMVFRLLKEG